jgi:GMC oxidoreductase
MKVKMGLLILSFFTLLALVYPAILSPQDLQATPTPDTYDYVVVGCGIAGLVVSMRLSEDENVSVICLEAGPL